MTTGSVKVRLVDFTDRLSPEILVVGLTCRSSFFIYVKSTWQQAPGEMLTVYYHGPKADGVSASFTLYDQRALTFESADKEKRKKVYGGPWEGIVWAHCGRNNHFCPYSIY